VAQVARWFATLKSSGCLCFLDGEKGKRRLNEFDFSRQIIDAGQFSSGIITVKKSEIPNFHQCCAVERSS
jgi:hypothetical protein